MKTLKNLQNGNQVTQGQVFLVLFGALIIVVGLVAHYFGLNVSGY